MCARDDDDNCVFDVDNGKVSCKSFCESVIPITQIDPTQVMVEREEDHRFCWMMRDSGYDTIRGH